MDVKTVQHKLAMFARERDWDQFHSPKNLAMALAGEAGELLEVFQWLTEDQSRNLGTKPERKQWATEELADVVIYALRLADKMDIDIETAILDKIAKNAEKYPVELAKGNAEKYNRRK